jgi:hypothetical protein
LKHFFQWAIGIFSVYGAVPYTITDEEYLKATVQRLIDYRVGPIEGFTSNYDYEKGQWKK